MSDILTQSDPAPLINLSADKAIAKSGWFGWATFLAASWTWCIGMFLPCLLVRDYGFLGWVIFAIPNVVGAAAMGWVLRDAAASRHMVKAHHEAAKYFSAVTIAFHLFFVVSVIAPLALSILKPLSSMDFALGGSLALSALMYLYMTRRDDSDRVLAVVVMLISAAAFAWVAGEMISIGGVTSVLPELTYSNDLLWLTPVCIFGFLCCPYLDLTFHRARQFSPAPKASFGVGFGVLFLSMIVFTLLYSQTFFSGRMTPWIAIFLFVHMAFQSTFTMAAHARELQHGGERAAAVAAILTVVAWIIYWSFDHKRIIGNLWMNEVIYRCFMGFYGLVFPAYVWLLIVPARGGGEALTIRNLCVCALAILIALPMFAMGFVAGKMIWLVPGMAVILLARLLIRVNQQNSAPI